MGSLSSIEYVRGSDGVVFWERAGDAAEWGAALMTMRAFRVENG